MLLSTERRGDLVVADARDAESRLSLEGLPRGVGMLILPLPVTDNNVSAWGALRTSAPSLTASNE